MIPGEGCATFIKAVYVFLREGRRRAAVKKKKSSPKSNKRNQLGLSGSALSWHSEILKLRKEIQSLRDESEKQEEKIQDIEIHLNLLTRLITTLCIEKFGMRIGVLKRMIKRIEKEAIRDSQILHLETLYKLPPSAKPPENSGSEPPSKNDPWEEIS